MTGHGAARAELGAASIRLEIRCVNHRHFDARLSYPKALAAHAPRLEATARKRLIRGRVQIALTLDRGPSGEVELDKARAKSAYLALNDLHNELELSGELPLSILDIVPDLFRAAELDEEDTTRILDRLCHDACSSLIAMQQAEGAAVANDVRGHLDRLEAEVEAVSERLPQVLRLAHEKLKARLGRLLDEKVEVDGARLAQEIAILADRSDVSEELARLRSHFVQARAMLDDTEEIETGRKLDFLLQEMSRETNTLGAKSADAELAQAVVRMKAAISKMREQAQNLL